MRILNLIDHCIINADNMLRTIYPPQKRHTERESPANQFAEPILSHDERQHIAGLLRVNHAGEVCAQALYQGQAITAKLETTRTQMNLSAQEERDHLGWCEQRLKELKNKPSLLNPVWYAGSLLLGICAGLIGDSWSLGFVAETERQVTAHLMRHIERLPLQDQKTHAILSQMKMDEEKHAEIAINAGAKELPLLLKQLMYFTSKLLTTSSYYF